MASDAARSLGPVGLPPFGHQSPTGHVGIAACAYRSSDSSSARSQPQMKIGFVLLAHERTDIIIRLIRRLTQHGDLVALHYDLKSGEASHRKILDALRGNRRVVLAERVAVKWGEWSVVQATLNCLEALAETAEPIDYVYLLSGSCYPTRPLPELHAFLERNLGEEFIECRPADRARFVTRGIQCERYRFFHYLNWRDHPQLFGWSLRIQAVLKVWRWLPNGMTAYIGSQWWTLTWQTCEAIRAAAKDPQIVRFFRRVWVPDELFFQTLAAHLASKARIRGRTLTLYHFSPDYGIPITFSNGHERYLAAAPFFFARKLSPDAEELRDYLDDMDGLSAPALTDDRCVGSVPADYTDFLSVHRYGLFGVRPLGRIQQPDKGDLDWNRQAYFVLIAASEKVLTKVASYLRANADLTCHEGLFAPPRIGFENGMEQYAGFSSSDVALRDFAPENFLVRILAASPLYAGFTWCIEDDHPVLGSLIADPNCRFVLIESDPFEEIITESTAGAPVDAAMADTQCTLTDRFYRTYLPQTLRMQEVKERLLHNRARVISIGNHDQCSSDLLGDVDAVTRLLGFLRADRVTKSAIGPLENLDKGTARDMIEVKSYVDRFVRD